MRGYLRGVLEVKIRSKFKKKKKLHFRFLGVAEISSIQSPIRVKSIQSEFIPAFVRVYKCIYSRDFKGSFWQFFFLFITIGRLHHSTSTSISIFTAPLHHHLWSDHHTHIAVASGGNQKQGDQDARAGARTPAWASAIFVSKEKNSEINNPCRFHLYICNLVPTVY